MEYHGQRARLTHHNVSESQVVMFQQLNGLPTYGPMAIGFPQEWGSRGREGLVVRFTMAEGATWVGNFRPGIGGLDDVRSHPDGRQVLVFSAGALWCVDPESRTADEIEPAVFSVWEIDGFSDLLLDNQGLTLARLGPSGVVWSTRRISWDGFRNVRFEAGRLVGEAWTFDGDRWLPFSVALEDGQVDGGSYTGPEMRLDHPQAE
jgi:hypothetical protein